MNQIYGALGLLSGSIPSSRFPLGCVWGFAVRRSGSCCAREGVLGCVVGGTRVGYFLVSAPAAVRVPLELEEPMLYTESTGLSKKLDAKGGVRVLF